MPQLAIADGSTLPAHYPAGVDWDIEIPVTDIPAIFNARAHQYRDRAFIDFMGRKMTYGETNKLVFRVANGLQKMGIGTGKKVGLHMPNSPYYPIMFLAILRTGATVVNFSTACLEVERDLKSQIEDSGVDTMVTVDLKRIYDMDERMVKSGLLKKIIVCPFAAMLPLPKSLLFRLFRRGDIAKIPASEQIMSFDDLAKNDTVHFRAEYDPDRPAVLQYTGGTSGVTKAAVLTHRNLVANAAQIGAFFGRNQRTPAKSAAIHDEGERIFNGIPNAHIFGMMVGMIAGIFTGSTLVIVPDPKNLKHVVAACETSTIIPAVPKLLRALAGFPGFKKADTGGIKAVISGGSPLLPSVLKDFESAARLPGIVYQGYGMSECSPIISSNPPHGKNKPESVGMPYPGTEIRIADPENLDRIMNTGEVGEILVRGPQRMKGYYNNAAETAGVMVGDGWLKTGDLGYLDDDLYLTIVDRSKDVIFINSLNVYPTQIEQVIAQHPAVAEVIVIGVDKGTEREAAKAFIRFHPHHPDTPDEKAFRQWMRDNLSGIMVPRFVEFRDEPLPATTVGKPDRKALAEQHAQRAAAMAALRPRLPELG